MPVLNNPKWEAFAVELSKNVKPTQAFENAGFSSKGAGAGASRLLRNVSVLSRVAELKAVVSSQIVKALITEKNARIADLQDIRDRIARLIIARSEEHADVKGGDTGLVVRELKAIGSGPGQRVVEQYTADTGLLRELREYLKQAAIEMGQFSEKRELSGPNGGPIQVAQVDLSGLSDEELAMVEKLVESATRNKVTQQ